MHSKNYPLLAIFFFVNTNRFFGINFEKNIKFLNTCLFNVFKNVYVEIFFNQPGVWISTTQNDQSLWWAEKIGMENLKKKIDWLLSYIEIKKTKVKLYTVYRVLML